MKYDYDVIVLGLGHAGAEASHISAMRGAKTLAITGSESDIGAMSCNPSIGGVGKSQLVAEIDALGGLMSRCADISGIQFRTLNMSKGPATQSVRAQIDRTEYRKNMREFLSNTKNLDLVFSYITDIDLSSDVKKVKCENGKEYTAKALVLTMGTFLNGVIFQGKTKIPSGRFGEDGLPEKPALNISETLKKAGISMLRLKTGTPARIYKDSINIKELAEQKGDVPEPSFSISERTKLLPQISCYLLATNSETHKIIRDNINDAPMYSGEIKGVGIRYCPSIEDKVMRFPHHETHHVFLEPEGLNSDLIYPNGISSSFSCEIQDKYIRTIKGLENCKVKQYGYAIEYDAIDARELKASLESKDIAGLFFAGQINGTSGYEEAAAQGILAGINAAGFALNSEALILKRTESYIGVLADDITTMGLDEPYRMFTSRSEYRLSIRVDNAPLRLSEKAIKLNLFDDKLKADFEKFKSDYEIAKNELLKKNPDEKILNELGKKPVFSAETDITYSGYIKRQSADIELYNRDFDKKIPIDFDYKNLAGLTNELKEKLIKTRPETIASASSISGMTPSAIMLIIRDLKKTNADN